MSTETTIDPRELTSIAAAVAVKTGQRILDLRKSGVDVSASKSSETDIVTEADREAERLIVDALRSVRPDDGVFGEEGASREGSTGVTWVIDPIDGTVNYLYDLPAYTVSIAATVPDDNAFADGRRAIAAAVYNPRTGELFEAYTGGGARLNGEPLRVTEQTDLSLSLVATGFGYTVERRTYQAGLIAGLIPRVRDIRRFGSAAYDLCQVAAGRYDAYYEIGLQPWDYAAGVLIAQEAGATLIGREDGVLPGEPFIFAGNESLVHALRSALLSDG